MDLGEPLDRHRRDGANQITKHHKGWYRFRQRLHRVQTLCVEAQLKLKLKLKEDASAKPAPGSNRYYPLVVQSDDDENTDERDCAVERCHAKDLKTIRIPDVYYFSPKVCGPHRRDYRQVRKDNDKAVRSRALRRALIAVETAGPTGPDWSQHPFAWEPLLSSLAFEGYLARLEDPLNTWPSRTPRITFLDKLHDRLWLSWEDMWEVLTIERGQPNNDEEESHACPHFDECGQVREEPPSRNTLTLTQGNNLFHGRTKLPLGLYLELMARDFCPTHRPEVARIVSILERVLSTPGTMNFLIKVTSRYDEGNQGDITDWQRHGTRITTAWTIVDLTGRLHKMCGGSRFTCSVRIHKRAIKVAEFLFQAQEDWKRTKNKRRPPLKTLIVPPPGTLWCSDMVDILGEEEVLSMPGIAELPTYDEPLTDVLERHESYPLFTGDQAAEPTAEAAATSPTRESGAKDAEDNNADDNNGLVNTQALMFECNDLDDLKLEHERRLEGDLDEDLDVGKCLQATITTQGGLELLTVLDTGAGVSIAGEGLETKIQLAGMKPYPIEKISLKISGVNSGAPVEVVGLIRVPLRFRGSAGHPDVDLNLAVVLVREWKGDLLLSWRTLRRIGFNFRMNAQDIPIAACFRRLGVEVPLLESENPEVRMAREVGKRVNRAIYDREVALIKNQVQLRTKKRGGLKSSREQIQRMKDLRKDLGIHKTELCRELLKAEAPRPSLLEDKKKPEEPQEEPEAPPPEAKEAKSSDAKERDDMLSKPRTARTKQHNKRRRDVAVNAREASRASLSDSAVEKLVESHDKQEAADLEGWSAGPQVLERIALKGWTDPLTVIGRKASVRVMALLKEKEEGVVVFPFTEASSHTFEALDRMVAVPFCVPTALMIRKSGKTITNMPWVAIRFGPRAKAEAWRNLSREYFKTASTGNEVETKNNMTDLWPRKSDGITLDFDGEEMADRVFITMKSTILSNHAVFHSHSLQQEEEDEAMLEEMLAPEQKLGPALTIKTLREAMEKATGKPISKEIHQLAWKYKEVFGAIKPGGVKAHTHTIDLNTKRELRAAAYPLRDDNQKKAAREEIEKLLKGGMIKEVKTSHFQAPVVMAKKKSSDGKPKWRFCVDFRLLNEHTVPDVYPMPNLERQLDIGKANFFTKLDLSSAFWQIPLAERDQLKTTFHFEGRSFVWLVMPFGLKNAPPTFQRLVDKVLAGLIGRGVYAYIDDILIYSKTREEHDDLVRQVLERLQAAGLRVSLEKSTWCTDEVAYLGYIIGRGTLKMDPAKIAAIRNIKTPPQTQVDGRYRPDLRKQVRSFLGAAGFYRKFIRDYAILSATLTDLTKTTQKPVWREEHTRAWRQIQEGLATYPILRQPDPDKEYIVDTDASNVGMGAVLLQRDEKAQPHPVCYASRKLTPAEQRYSTREQEALAILFAVEKFEPFIKGRRFTVITDHRSLSWLMTTPTLKGRLLNWAYKLRSFDFSILYRKGSENKMADMLSRLVYKIDVEVNLLSVLSVERVKSETVRMSTVARIMHQRDNGSLKITSEPSRILERTETPRRREFPPHKKETVVITEANPLREVKKEDESSEYPSEVPKRKRGRPPKGGPAQQISEESERKLEAKGPLTRGQARRKAQDNMAPPKLGTVPVVENKDHKKLEPSPGSVPSVAESKIEAKAEIGAPLGQKDQASPENETEMPVAPAPVEAKAEAPNLRPDAPPQRVADEKKEVKHDILPDRLILSELDLAEVRAWDIPHEEAWRARLREDKDLAKLLKTLEGTYIPTPKELETMKGPARAIAAVDGLLVTKRRQKLGDEWMLAAVLPYKLRVQKIADIHETEHKSADHTVTAIRAACIWWPGMRADVEKYVGSCIWCAMVNAGKKGKGLWVGWGLEPRRLECLHIDFCGPLKTATSQNRYVFSMIDRATGWPEMVATADCTAATAVKAVIEVWICRYGVPKLCISDNGRHFTAKQFKAATDTMGIRLKHTTTYHPQSNGIAERRFRDLGKAMKLFSEVKKEWDEIIPEFLFTLRKLNNSRTGFSPATLLLGEGLRTPFSISGHIGHLYDDASEMRKAIWKMNLAENIVADKKLKMFRESEIKAQERFLEKDFAVGDEVFTRLHRMPQGESKKTWLSWEGPFKVTKVNKLTVAIDKRGREAVVNKTTIVALRHEVINPRDIRGRANEPEPDDVEEQDARFKEKTRAVKKRLANLDETDSDEEDVDLENQEQDALEIKDMQNKLEKLSKRRPPQKRTYTDSDIKVHSMCIAFAMGKTRLCKVLMVRDVENDPKAWIRLQLFGKQEVKDPEKKMEPTWRPWWLGTRNRQHLASQPGPNYSEFWADVYVEDILYVLKHPLLPSGGMNSKDSEVMTQLWGNTLNVLTIRGEILH